MANLYGSLVYVFNNQTGNVEALYKADSSNELLAEYEYTPFGETRRQSGDLAEKNPLRYSTRYHEGNTGLYYYGFRHYSPVTKKWLSQDPIGEKGGYNLYQFAYNNPTNFIDTLGLCCKIIMGFGHGPTDKSRRDTEKGNKTPAEVSAGTDLFKYNEGLGVSNPEAVIIPFGCNAKLVNGVLAGNNGNKGPIQFPGVPGMPDRSVLGVYGPESKANALVNGIADLIKGLCDGSIPAPWGNKKCPKIDVEFEGSDFVPEQGPIEDETRNNNFSGKDAIVKQERLVNKIKALDKNCK